MLKIETSSPSASEIRVVLTGWIHSEHLPELERLLREAAAAGRQISFDLSQVGLVDREVVDFLAAGPALAARLDGCPAYLRAWLKSVGRHADSTHEAS
jgi:hypothetical protein